MRVNYPLLNFQIVRTCPSLVLLTIKMLSVWGVAFFFYTKNWNELVSEVAGIRLNDSSCLDETLKTKIAGLYPLPVSIENKKFPHGENYKIEMGDLCPLRIVFCF